MRFVCLLDLSEESSFFGQDLVLQTEVDDALFLRKFTDSLLGAHFEQEFAISQRRKVLWRDVLLVLSIETRESQPWQIA